MDYESNDWKDFVENTVNLNEAKFDDYFETDYGGYSLICMASTKRRRLRPKNIKPKDVEAVYERSRNKIIVTTSSDSFIISKLNKINGIKSYLYDECYSPVEIPENATIFIGDNWYIVFNGQQITSSLVLDFDQKAKIEFESTKKILEEYLPNNIQQVNIEQVVQNLKTPSPEVCKKVLRLKRN